MNKFILTVLGVSAFFIGLGGIVKQISSIIKPERTALIEKVRAPMNAEEIDSVKSFTIFEKTREPLVISRSKEEIPDGKFEVRVPAPDQPDETIRVQRQLSEDNLKRVEELPRKTGKKIVIIRNREGERFKVSEERELPPPNVQVFIDKEKQSN